MRLTASALSRAEECIGSIVLDGYDESGPYAATGNAVDHFVQTAKTKSKALALKEAPADLRPYLESLTLERIPDGAEYQVAFAFNALTGEVRRIPGRAAGYPDLGDEWILGTADIVGVRDGRAIVIDLKWGSYTIGRDPADDLQTGFYGLCAARIAGVEEVEVGFSRAGWDGVLRPEMAILDEMAIDALADRIRAIWRQARAAANIQPFGEAPRLRIGDWCGYCPARRGCDAWVQPTALMLSGEISDALVRSEAMTIEGMRARIEALTPEQRGRAFEIADEMEDRAKLVKQAVRDDARTAPVPLSGGRELREVQWGASQSSPVAKAEIEALKEGLKARGEIVTVKVPQVRPMKARP